MRLFSAYPKWLILMTNKYVAGIRNILGTKTLLRNFSNNDSNGTTSSHSTSRNQLLKLTFIIAITFIITAIDLFTTSFINHFMFISLIL